MHDPEFLAEMDEFLKNHMDSFVPLDLNGFLLTERINNDDAWSYDAEEFIEDYPTYEDRH